METNQRVDHSPADVWDAFDQIYCISLTQRTDRREKAEQEFRRVGLIGRVQFALVEKHPTNSEEGIFNSHMACLRAALATSPQRIVIFEDDILFRRFSPKILNDAIDFMKSDADWQLFFFGCFVKSSRKTAWPSVLRVKYRCAAHAYVIHRNFAERLIEIPWQGIAYDDLLRSLDTGHFYACYPTFGFQSGSSTDNDKTATLDRLIRLLGGSPRLQRWDEFSKRHIVPLVAAHVAAALLIVLIILMHLRHL